MEYSINTILVSTNDSTPSASLNESAFESEYVHHLRNEPVFSKPSIHIASHPLGEGGDVEIDCGEASFRTQAPGDGGPDRQRHGRNQCPNCGLGNARRDHAINNASCLMRQRRHRDVDEDSMLACLLGKLSIGQGSQTISSEARAPDQTNHTTVGAMELDDEAATPIPALTNPAPAPMTVVPVPAITIIPANNECIGLRLHFAVNRAPVSDYPVALHSLPNGPRWRSEIVGSTMFLTSFDCTGIADTSLSGPQWCINCRAIRFDPAYHVVQSAIVGTLPPPNAPFEHYSFNGFKTKIEEMNRRIRQLEIAKACLEKELDERKARTATAGHGASYIHRS